MPYDGGNWPVVTVPVVAPTVADKMLDILGPDGAHWTKYVLRRSSDGSRCLVGALGHALRKQTAGARYEPEWLKLLADASVQAGAKRADCDWNTVVYWNNAFFTGWRRIERTLKIMRAHELIARVDANAG